MPLNRNRILEAYMKGKYQKRIRDLFMVSENIVQDFHCFMTRKNP